MVHEYQLSAAAYERGRPEYPREAIQYLIESLRIEATSTVLDLAAGTGKLTRQLLYRSPSVIAVEPVSAMRDLIARRVPGVEVLDGRAESIPLPDQSVDAVTVGQAFHWFGDTEALEEIGRVLRPSGRLGLIWNVRDLATDEQAAVESVIAPHRGRKRTYQSGEWRSAFDKTSRFGPVQTKAFRHEHRVNRDRLLDLIRSISYMGALPPAEWESVSAQVNDLFEGFAAGRGFMTMLYETQVFWSELIDSSRVR